MKPIYRRTLIFVAAVIVLTGGYVAYRFVAASRLGIPQEFADARTEGALISERIVANTNEIAFAIAHLDESASNWAQASTTIGEILGKVDDIRAQAINLAGKLGTMTRALPEIRSDRAREAALESISQRLAVVSNLITYTDKVVRLTDLLRARIRDRADNAADIARLIADINAEVTAINNFNRAANESMERFSPSL